MALGARVASLVLASVGLVFGSSCVDPFSGASHGLGHATLRLARVARASVGRAKTAEVVGEPGQWPAPSPEALAQLEADTAAVRTVSAHRGDVFAEDPDTGPDGDSDGADPATASAISSDAPIDAERALGAIAKETFVYASPSWRAKKIGYLRGGAIVKRSPNAVGDQGCPGGWYRIAPMGFVCVGKHATLDVHHPLLTAAARRPDRTATLPYAYGMSEFPTPPFYTKLPTHGEQGAVEYELEGHLRQALDPGWANVSLEPIPELLAAGRQVPTWSGGTHSPSSVYTGRALPKSGFAFLAFFEQAGREFGLTVDLDIVPLDRMRRVVPSSFHGISLGGDVELPVVFVMSKAAHVHTGAPGKAGFALGRALGYREAVPITGKRVKIGGQAFIEAKSGEWLEDSELVRVDAMKNRPGWATPGRTWIDVSILKQALVAYEGDKPVYVTLVSTGADGLGDPKETHSTVRGQYLIHTKHVTATMSGDELGDEFDLRDVPYVQYFMDGYALHAAYWHDSFGHPRSHGCVNLSPMDARWLFHWSDPPVPQGWHGAMSLHDGTLVHIHP